MSAELLAQMIDSLRALDVDLGDERDVMRKLIASEYRSGDVIRFMDDAVEGARARGQKLSFGG